MKKHRLLFLCCIFALLFVLTAWYIYEHRPKTICELYNINTDEIVSVSFVLFINSLQSKVPRFRRFTGIIYNKPEVNI